jgi:hypothetical protein
MIGRWEFSNADPDKVCRLSFRADPASGGSKLNVDKNCPDLFFSTRDLAARMIDGDGTLRLLNASGSAVSAAAASSRTAEEMMGEWAISRRGGKPICAITLALNSAGPDPMAVRIKPGCDALFNRFAPISWRMRQSELLLLSARGQSWRFEEGDANTWQRVQQGIDPILPVRR